MTGRIPVVLGLVAALGTSGCAGMFGQREAAPEPLPAVPAAPVKAAALPPPVEQPKPVEEEPKPEPAALPPPEQQLAIDRSQLLGGWTIESGGERCQLFMVLTGWSGGYRASTRGCQSPELKGVSAWNLAGKEITLKDSATAPVATLYATEATRFNGRLATGAAVSVYR
jgi:hypothetical protein